MNWWSRLLRRGRVEAELEAELRDHLERQVADYIRDGYTEQEARRRARLEFGGVEQVKELCRDARGTRLVEELAQDVGYAARLFRKSPGFTAVAVLTLALGLGANMAVFGLVEALLMRPLPVRNPGELIVLIRVQGPSTAEHFDLPQVTHLAAQSAIFSSLCAFGTDTFNVGNADTLEPTPGAWVTGSYYETLGLQSVAGRLLTPEDDRLGAPVAAVITYDYWTRKFARDPGIIGRHILIDGVPVTIVGVTPPKFTGAVVGEAAAITLAINVRPQVQPDRASFLEAGARWLRILARAHEHLPRDQVKAQLGVIWTEWLHATVSPALSPEARARALSLTLDVRTGETGSSSLRNLFRTPLLALMVLVALVLLIACVNVANLMLARSTTRQREVALRLAVGAGRWRIARQLLTESGLLAIAGAGAGALVGMAGSRALVSLIGGGQFGPDSSAVSLDLSVNWRVFAFAALAAAMTTVLFGVLPALRAARVAPSIAMNVGSHRLAETRRRAASVLVTAQVALSLLLLIGAGLFVGTLNNLRTLDRGFRHEGVLLATVDAARAGYSGARLDTLNREVIAFAERVPGVRIASVASTTPLRGGGISRSIALNGQRVESEIYFNHVAARYFEALDTPVLLGREFTAYDDGDAPAVAVVNEAFVRQHLPDGNPLGQRISVNGSTDALQVVGVVKDAVYESLRQTPPPTIYTPFWQRGLSGRGGQGITLVLYAPGSLAPVAAAVRAEVQPRLAGKPVRIQTLTAQLERSLTRERLMAAVATAFGALALTLAAVGLYGLLAYWVARRTQEIGIRVALGAQRSTVLRLVLSDALRMLALGIAFGVPAAWALARYVSSLLFGLTTTDPTTIAVAAGVLTLTGLAAASAPARRATRVNPLVALRTE
jgi:putative ABC transport system permease protein